MTGVSSIYSSHSSIINLIYEQVSLTQITGI
jgi:hypothetical protein